MSLKTRQKSSTVLQRRHLGAGAFPPNFCLTQTASLLNHLKPLLCYVMLRIFRKSNRKGAFWVILRILLVKRKHLPPLPKTKKSIAVIVKRRFYMIFRCFAMEDYVKKGENFKFVWSWT